MAVAATGLCLLASSVLAQVPGLTKEEAACESNTGKTLSKFTSSKAKCISKCFSTARKTSGPYGGCQTPYSDPTTFACITDPAKGAEVKARQGIVKKCNVAGKDSCPECYNPNDCTLGAPFVAQTETNIDVFPPLVYCLEIGTATTPSKDQAKCEDGVSKALVKFTGSKTKCYDKCNKNMQKGTVPLGACNPPATDPATVACISDPLKGAEGKAAAAIDKVCANVPGATPPCYLPTLATGADWVGVVEGIIDVTTQQVACGSPSGAFLN